MDAMGRVTARRPVLRVDGDRVVDRPDTLAGEEPLEIRVGGRPYAVTMRTPGHDQELAAGFLVSEGVLSRRDQLATMRYCAGSVVDDETGMPANTYNVLDVALAADQPAPDPSRERNVYTSSSCGVCGTASLDAVRSTAAFSVREDPARVSAAVLTALPDLLRAGQEVFGRTGGLHAAGLFTAGGELVCLREDVGRHNAVDKVVGWALRDDRLPLRGHVLLVSGRASFELVQKAWCAGVPVLAAVSAPSSLAVDLALEAGMTLVGFLRGDAFNVYAGRDRVVLPGSERP